MAEMQEYKCPSCGGAIAFDPHLQKMKCPYCDTEFEMETLRAYDEELKNEQADNITFKQAEENAWRAGEEEGMRVFVCQSCGGEIVGDENIAATSCPFCGNPVVLMGQFTGDLRPDYVIPFKLDREAAKAGFRKHLLKKRLLPKTFKEETHIDDIQGMYVPFWLFDADVDANIRYRTTRVRSWSDANYRYTETSHYSVTRGGQIAFAHVPVDGSEKMADDLMESIEPYDFADAVDFQTAYLAGYLADRYDVSAEQSHERAAERIKHSTEEEFAKTVQGYASVVTEQSSVRLTDGAAKYALYPVWTMTTRWKDKSYLFAMNGQTGKFVGNLPLDKKAYFRWLFMLTGILAAATFLGIWLFTQFGG